jgi:hypothetical protein
MPQTQAGELLIILRCRHCSASFECVEGSSAQDDELCNRCWARKVEQGYAEREASRS